MRLHFQISFMYIPITELHSELGRTKNWFSTLNLAPFNMENVHFKILFLENKNSLKIKISLKTTISMNHKVYASNTLKNTSVFPGNILVSWNSCTSKYTWFLWPSGMLHLGSPLNNCRETLLQNVTLSCKLFWTALPCNSRDYTGLQPTQQMETNSRKCLFFNAVNSGDH